MTRPTITTTWERPRFVAAAQLQDASLNNLVDVDWNNIFAVATTWTWELVPVITTNWS